MTRPKRLSPHVRETDRVRVANPEFFVRVGYPMTLAGEEQRVREDRRAAIESFLAAEGVSTYQLPSLGCHKAVAQVARILAYWSCKQKGWGGRERRIYTHRIESLAGAEFDVQGVRFVKTGTYEPASTRGSYDGYDYEPAYLSNEKTHRIVRTTLYGVLPGSQWSDVLEIEACHLEVVEKRK